jgi:EAL domain-containing protein (putative c-di-GMP-specific phosphodiesterase class I)
MKKADTALYSAKEAGRNTYRFFDARMNVDALEHLAIRNDLRRALERDEFVLHYQPQVSAADGTVLGAEALVRWNHPTRGLVPPGSFIAIAEDSGLIVPLGEWVLRQACADAAAWRAAGHAVTVAVNLSALQFKRGNLEDDVRAALHHTGLPPEALELELTESILIKDTENVLAKVRNLHALGIELSIDDFGTGYSSLSYLQRFQVDKLKIDQSFVRALTREQDSAAIVTAIIQMAHGLNLKTIAEGVEDQDTLAALRRQGCDQIQGYLTGRPMPIGDFREFLAAGA